MEELLLAIIILLAQITKTITSFGSGVITVSLAGLFLPFHFIIPVAVVLNLLMNTYILVRHRKTIAVSEILKVIAPLTLIGLPFGLWGFYSFKNVLLQITFAAFILFLSVWEIILHRKKNKQPSTTLSKKSTVLVLFSAGFFNGLYSSGGPLIVYYLARKIKDKSVFRSTVASSLFVLNIFVVSSYLVQGVFDVQLAKTVLFYIPVLLLGIFIGEKLHNKINDEKFRFFIFVVLAILGIFMLLRALQMVLETGIS